MQRQQARPSGRRKITPAQLHAELSAIAVPGRPSAMTPGRALAAFKRAEPALGVAAKVVKLVDYLIGCTREVDWDGTGLGPLAWPSDAELEDRLGVGRSQRKQIVQAALEGGYVRLRRSANGKRYGGRDKSGRITHAYGFDLSPLAERAGEFMRLTAEWEARRAEGKQMRREIASLRGEVCALAELAMDQRSKADDWQAFTAQADALLRQRGRNRDPLSLWPIVARLRALHIHVRELVAAATEDAGDYEETGPMGPVFRPHITTTNQLPIVDTITSGANAHGQEERSKELEPGSVSTKLPRQAVRDTSALRGFVATPGFVLAVAPAFRLTAGSAHPDWAELTTAAFQVCYGLGVSKHAWGQACIMLGPQAAVLALASISARHTRGLVQSPGGLLRRMVELHEGGSLRLDRTLFGLADELTRQRGSGAVGSARNRPELGPARQPGEIDQAQAHDDAT